MLQTKNIIFIYFITFIGVVPVVRNYLHKNLFRLDPPWAMVTFADSSTLALCVCSGIFRTLTNFAWYENQE